MDGSLFVAASGERDNYDGRINNDVQRFVLSVGRVTVLADDFGDLGQGETRFVGIRFIDPLEELVEWLIRRIVFHGSRRGRHGPFLAGLRCAVAAVISPVAQAKC